jgi:membrane protease YdiL (CAAX protease family)
MSTSASDTLLQKSRIASKAHTAGLLAIILIFAALGRIFVGNQSPETLEAFGRIPIYLVALAGMWFLVVYTLMGLRREGLHWRQIIDASPWTVRGVCIYALVAVAMFIVWSIFGLITRPLLRLDPDQVRNIMVLLPGTMAERSLWVALSLSAGFCEEFIYRGYFLRQFQHFTGSIVAAIVLQAVCYGIAHAALPFRIVVLVTCLGILFGSVAAWRRTLVPGMLMHAALDLLALARR